MDVAELRRRARENIESGNVTSTYGGDARDTIAILQNALATEIVCVLRYKMNAICATGISSEGVVAEFEEHAKDEQQHGVMIAERINQLGGEPNFNPDGLSVRSVTQYVKADNLVDMIKENLIAERMVVDHYRDLTRFFGENDPTTRYMIERILTDEEEHVNEMHDLLVAHEGVPMLPAS